MTPGVMTMSLRKKFLAATVLAGAATALFSSGAMAYDARWYVGAGAGWEHMDDGWTHGQFSIDDGYIADGRVGVQSDNSPWRYELDTSYRKNEVSGGLRNTAVGNINILSGMFDVIYDFAHTSALHPYVGLGGGLARLEYNPNGINFAYSGKTVTLAGQALAGLEYKVTQNLSLNVEYRYFVLDNPTFKGTTGGLDSSRKESFGNHSVLAGLRWTFGAAPPPPPPPAPPPVAAPPPPALPVFKIFFPWNQFKLTPEAKKTVDEIASQYKDKKITKINIQGNTDTSGTADYNMGLGSKRSDSVKAELIAQGIPDSVISTESAGETNPAVQTGDNVREPLNRRAEVTIQVQ
jgi:outer membrane protein OmpA-like peptidoglycan-associated protein